MANRHVEKIRLNATSHSVRAAQAVLQYGVGAMVDFPSQTLMTAAPEYWRDQIVQVHDERLEKSLGGISECLLVEKTEMESRMLVSQNGIFALNVVAFSHFRNGSLSLMKKLRRKNGQIIGI